MREDRLSVLILRVFAAIVLLGVILGSLRAMSSPPGSARRERFRGITTCREVSSVSPFPDRPGTDLLPERPPFDGDEVARFRAHPETPSALTSLPNSPSIARFPENPRLARIGLLRC
jgi:hypothetical protein